MSTETSEKPWHIVTIRLPCMSNAHAEIMKGCLDVDLELGNSVRRWFAVDDDNLAVTYETKTVRLARLAVNAFLENLHFIVGMMGDLGGFIQEWNEKNAKRETMAKETMERIERGEGIEDGDDNDDKEEREEVDKDEVEDEDQDR